MVKVGIFQCAEYDPYKIKDALETGLASFGGITAFVGKEDKVLLKPNLLTAALPEEAVCTHPAVLEGVILLLEGACRDIWVGDSPGFGSTQTVAGSAGLEEVCRRRGVQLVPMNTPVPLGCPEGKTAREFNVADWVVKADKIINLPKLKLHNLMTFTGAVKNMMGVLPGIAKGRMHVKHPGKTGFAHMLLDVYSCARPVLSIMDAIVAMEGEGPRSGRPKQVGLLLAGDDGVALDAVACSIIGLQPMSVPTIRLGHGRQLGQGHLRKIETVGTDLASARVKDFDLGHGGKFGFLYRLLGRERKIFPEINREKCTACAICVEACPLKRISIEEGAASIDYSGCIACLCCQELCPKTAINLQGQKR